MNTPIHLKVVGENKMNCGGCERSVVGTLKSMTGVENARADHTTQDVDVWLGSHGPSLEEITTELGEIGYQVVPA